MSYVPKSAYINPKTGGTMTGGSLFVNPTPGGDPNDGVWCSPASGTARIATDAISGLSGGLVIRTGSGSSDRWYMYKSSASETGSNDGSNLHVNRYDDTAGFLGYALSSRRNDGIVYPEHDPTTPMGVSTQRYFATRWPSSMWGGVVGWTYNGSNGDHTWNITATTGFTGIYAISVIPWGYPECMNFCVITNNLSAFVVRATTISTNYAITYNPLNLMTMVWGTPAPPSAR